MAAGSGESGLTPEDFLAAVREAEVEEEWREEVRRRLEAYRAGEIEAEPARKVLEEARDRPLDRPRLSGRPPGSPRTGGVHP